VAGFFTKNFIKNRSQIHMLHSIMNTLKISIIMPNYNGANYIADAIRSVRAQTLTDWECIIIDDGSTDDSANIIRREIAGDKCFRTLFQENRGASCARNAGLDIARGEYITFLDSDDCYTPVALEAMYNEAVKHNADNCGGEVLTVADDFVWRLDYQFDDSTTGDNLLFVNDDGRMFPDYLDIHEKLGDKYKMVWVWRQIYRREVIGAARFVPGMFPGEDICFLFDILSNIKKFCIIGTPVVYHRISKTSSVNSGMTMANMSYHTGVLEYIHANRDRYPSEFMNVFLKDFTQHFYGYVFYRSAKQQNFREVIAEELRTIRRKNLLPLNTLKWHQRVLLRLFLWAFPHKD